MGAFESQSVGPPHFESHPSSNHQAIHPSKNLFHPSQTLHSMTSHNTAAMASALSIPELVRVIAQSLSSSSIDLFHCTHVCQTWRQIFIPYLWHTINDHDHDTLWQSILRYKHSPEDPGYSDRIAEQEAQREKRNEEMFRMYGHFIRDIYMGSVMTLKACLASVGGADDGGNVGCTRLQGLSFRVHPHLTARENDDHERAKELLTRAEETRQEQIQDRNQLDPVLAWELLQKQDPVHLRRLCILTDEGSLVEDWPQWYVLGEVLEKVLTFKHLRELRAHVPEEVLEDFMRYFPDLEILDSTTDADGAMNQWLQEAEAEERDGDTPLNLKELLIWSFENTVDDFLTMLERFPGLEKVQMTVHRYDTLGTSDALYGVPATGPFPSSRVFPRMRELSLRDDVDCLETVLPSLPNLTHFYSVDSITVGSAMALATCTCFDSLVVIDFGKQLPVEEETHSIPRMHDPRSDKYAHPLATFAVNLILGRCTNLRELTSGRMALYAPHLERYPFGCLGLKKLVCPIEGIPFLQPYESRGFDSLLKSLGFPSGDQVELKHVLETVAAIEARKTQPTIGMKEVKMVETKFRSKVIQEMVYTQLGRLEELVELNIGYEEFEFSNRAYPDTVQWTIDGGLETLTGLTKLEILGLEGVDTRWREEEIEWMARAWPRLRVVYGLFRDRRDCGLGGEAFESKRRVLLGKFKDLRPEVRQETRLFGESGR